MCDRIVKICMGCTVRSSGSIYCGSICSRVEYSESSQYLRQICQICKYHKDVTIEPHLILIVTYVPIEAETFQRKWNNADI